MLNGWRVRASYFDERGKAYCMILSEKEAAPHEVCASTSKGLKQVNVGLAISAVQIFGSWFSPKVSHVRHSSRVSAQEGKRRCEESSMMYVLRKEDQVLVSVPSVVDATGWK